VNRAPEQARLLAARSLSKAAARSLARDLGNVSPRHENGKRGDESAKTWLLSVISIYSSGAGLVLLKGLKIFAKKGHLVTFS
jgi:hypothetical protein